MFGRRSIDKLKDQLHEKLHHKFLSTYGAVYLDIADDIIIHFDPITRDDIPQFKKTLSSIVEMEYHDYPRPPFSHGLQASTPLTNLQALIKGLDKLPDLNSEKLDKKYFSEHHHFTRLSVFLWCS